MSVRVVIVASLANVFGVRSGCAEHHAAGPFLDLQPAFRSLGIGATVRCADLTVMCRQCSDAGDLDPGNDLLNFLVAHGTSAGSNHEARQPFRMERRVVERDESATSHTDQMDSSERQIIGERLKIVRGVSG